jgi:thioredoxin 1
VKLTKAMKIIVPVLMILVIVGIWFVKNNPKPSDELSADNIVVNDNKYTDNQTPESTDKPLEATLEPTAKPQATPPNPTDKPQEVTPGSTVKPQKATPEPTNKPRKTTPVPTGKLQMVTPEPTNKPQIASPTPTPVVKNIDFDLSASEIDLVKLKSYGLPIIIDFGADSCIPCKQMAPVLKELNMEMQGKVIVKFVDVWKYRNAIGDFPVQLIPTQFFFDKDGKPFIPKDAEAMQMRLYISNDSNEHIYTSHTGAMTKEQFIAVLKEMGVDN